MKMKLFSNIKDKFLHWCNGNPLLDDVIFKTIHDEFNVLLYVSCVFLDMRPKARVLSVFALIFQFFTCYAYLFTLGVTTKLQTDDFITATQNVHMAVLDILSLSILVLMNYNRSSVIAFLRGLSVNFFDYGDGFDIPEMVGEIKKSQFQKLIILICVPTYLAMTAACCMLGRTIDDLSGRGANMTYLNDVYMLTPVPMWYPMEINNDATHWFAVFTQVLGANVLALSVSGVDMVLIFFSQSLCIQFKILIYRIRKIRKVAYRLHRKTGGGKLKHDEMMNDPHYLKCYNRCLSTNAHHHAVIIEYFSHLAMIAKWITGMVLLLGSFLIAMSLLAFALGGGKPSILSLAAFLIIAETLNIAMLCSQSEQVKELGESLHEELYNVDWMDANTPAKRTIMIMIGRSKKPMVLVAGGLQPLNWETFGAIMNTSYTYVNLLIAM